MRAMIDGRMESRRLGPGNGVYSYYRMLERLGSGLPDFAVLHDRLSLGIDADTVLSRVQRLLRVPNSSIRTVDPANPPHDIFRLAALRFRLTGRISELEVTGPPGTMHWTYPVPLRVRNWRNIYTVHDALRLGPEGPPRSRKRESALLNAIRASSDAIVTVTDHARRDIAAQMGWAPDEIAVVPPAVFAPLVPPQTGPRSSGPILVLGTNGARKNIAFLLEAYLQSGIGRPIVIIGPENAYVASLKRRFAGRGAISFRGVMSDRDISAQLGRARCLAFPSLSEGFGLPIVEAMSHGCPVICANSGAMAEVAGGASIAFTLGNQSELAAILRRVDSDDHLVLDRQTAGKERAKDFCEEAARQRLSVLYHS